ncbi:hypothetical protein GGR57DRAFT_486001 [Xylariaceae sp. FL1272]|nr:hypothetical protein GGR57DRAFT_486001 [Xylariaceae sp. FL1272]
MTITARGENATLPNLPASIRRRIYCQAGLVHNCCLILSRKKSQLRMRRFGMDASAGELRATYNLLQVCKDISREVGVLICAQNTFVLVHEEIDYGLSFLRTLHPAQCAALRNVSIQLHLHAPSMIYDRAPWEGRLNDPGWWPENEMRRDPPPLPSHRLASWKAAARHVLSNSRGELCLRIFCHTGYQSVTHEVLQPLREFPGSLRECELQLDSSIRSTHSQLRTLAWEVVDLAKGLDPVLRSDPFRFFDLPPEIRQYILQFTDLVTPFKEVYWDAKHGFGVTQVVHPCDAFSCRGFSNPRVQNAYRFLDCRHNGLPATERPGCRNRNTSQDRCPWNGDICCLYRTGYSARCVCWVKPTALLLASRRLYHEAIQVLYSQNSVIILPSEELKTPVGTIQKRFDVSTFITRHMWPETLHHIRTLECVFPAVDPRLAGDPLDPYYLDFCFAIDHLRNNSNVSQLTVIANVTVLSSVMEDDDRWFHEQLKKTTDLNSILSAHIHLLRPFQKLRGNAKFFVNLEWAWRWPWKNSTPFDMVCVQPRRQVLQRRQNEYCAEVQTLEVWLEAMIMGDDYDTKDRSKLKQNPSAWNSRIQNRPDFLQWGANNWQLFSYL